MDAVEATAEDDDSVNATVFASASSDDRPRNKYAPNGPSGSESSTEYSRSLLLSSDEERYLWNVGLRRSSRATIPSTASRWSSSVVNRVLSESALLRICERSRSRYSSRRRIWIASRVSSAAVPLISVVGREASRLSIAERRSARRESNSHTAACTAWLLPVNSRSSALRASGNVDFSCDSRSASMLSLCLRIADRGVRVSRAVSNMDSSWRWELARVSSGGVADGWKVLRGGYVAEKVMQLLGYRVLMLGIWQRSLAW